MLRFQTEDEPLCLFFANSPAAAAQWRAGPRDAAPEKSAGTGALQETRGLISSGVPEETADKVTAASGRDIVARKASAAAEKLRADGLQNQLSEANGKLSGCGFAVAGKGRTGRKRGKGRDGKVPLRHGAGRRPAGGKVRGILAADAAVLPPAGTGDFPARRTRKNHFAKKCPSSVLADGGRVERELPFRLIFWQLAFCGKAGGGRGTRAKVSGCTARPQNGQLQSSCRAAAERCTALPPVFQGPAQRPAFLRRGAL